MVIIVAVDHYEIYFIDCADILFKVMTLLFVSVVAVRSRLNDLNFEFGTVLVEYVSWSIWVAKVLH